MDIVIFFINFMYIFKKSIIDMKRYFIIFYIAHTEDGNNTGWANYITHDAYLNRYEVEKEIIKKYINFTKILFTNIIELNKSDYNDWTQEI